RSGVANWATALESRRIPRRSESSCLSRRTIAVRTETRRDPPSFLSVPPFSLRHLIRWQQPEPEEVVRPEREQVWQLADRRKRRVAVQLERHPPAKLSQVQLHELGEAREVVHAENDFVAIPT